MNGKTPRLPLLDLLRGLAIVAMVLYHGVWDVWSVGMLDIDPVHDPLSLWSRSTILGTFLLLVGMGTSLGAAGGWNGRRFLRRLGFLVLGAGAVTAASLIVFPATPIFFGVLHHIAVASLLALLLVRLPPFLVAALGVGILVLDGRVAFDVFNGPWLNWIGLATTAPPSNDYVPLVPWFGLVAIGVAVGRWERLVVLLARPRLESRFARILIRMGRSGLLIYLLHQPILYGAILGLATITGPWDPPGTRAFIDDCRTMCGSQGEDEPFCVVYCECAADRMVRRPDPSLDPMSRLQNAARECAVRAKSR